MTAHEEWRWVPGWENEYEVSTFGRIRKYLVLNPSGTGYVKVCLQGRSRGIMARIHQLVAAAFIGPCPEGMEVNHKNGDKADNRPENLEYVTTMENSHHARRHGLLNPARGEKAGAAKLTADNVLEIRASYAAGKENQGQLAARFGVAASYISSIVNRRKWKHI